jgi:hypothetical protein
VDTAKVIVSTETDTSYIAGDEGNKNFLKNNHN